MRSAFSKGENLFALPNLYCISTLSIYKVYKPKDAVPTGIECQDRPARTGPSHKKHLVISGRDGRPGSVSSKSRGANRPARCQLLPPSLDPSQVLDSLSNDSLASPILSRPESGGLFSNACQTTSRPVWCLVETACGIILSLPGPAPSILVICCSLWVFGS